MFPESQTLKKPEIKLVTVDVICLFISLTGLSLVSLRSRNLEEKQTPPKLCRLELSTLFFQNLWTDTSRDSHPTPDYV